MEIRGTVVYDSFILAGSLLNISHSMIYLNVQKYDVQTAGKVTQDAYPINVFIYIKYTY